MKHRKASWRPASSGELEAKRELPRFAAQYLRAGAKIAHKGVSASKLHKFRLATKHFRYLLDLFQPLYGPRMKPYLGKLRRIQTILGELNDYAVTREMMEGERGADRDLLLRYLDKEQKRRLKRFVRYWQTHFEGDEKRSDWITGLR